MERQLSLAQAFMRRIELKIGTDDLPCIIWQFFIFSKYAFLSNIGYLESQNYARKTNITVLLKDFTKGKLGDFDI